MSDAKTQVVNIRREAFDVYIGRRGHGHDGYFGNPFRTPPLTREEALARYRAYFDERLKTDPQFRRRALALKGKRLGCFCARSPATATSSPSGWRVTLPSSPPDDPERK